MPHVYAIILAGGSGTRFWPASRRAMPKQLLSIGPASTESLIAATVRRIERIVPRERVIVATGKHLVSATRKALPELREDALLGEPLARNTAPCIAWATSVIARRDPEARVMVLPSDHHIGDEAAFERCLARALDVAGEGSITTIGIRPTRAETGYGYIELGEPLSPDLHRVRRFVEKPDRARAEAYLRGGQHLWNSGMFFFEARVLLGAVRRHLPDLDAGLRQIEDAARRGAAEEAAATHAMLEALPSVSIDYGIMEKEQQLRVVSGSFDWNDLGSWESAWELGEKDVDGNVASSNAVLVDARRNLVKDLRSGGTKRVVALVGVDELCVIETDDALLVIPRERAQDAKLVIDSLSRRGDTDHT